MTRLSSISWVAVGVGVASLGLLVQRQLACGSCARVGEGPGVATANSAGARSAHLAVSGMSCASCGVTVRLALRRLDGVFGVNVDAAHGRVVVQYDPAKVTPDRLAQAISDAGYGAKVADPG